MSSLLLTLQVMYTKLEHTTAQEMHLMGILSNNYVHAYFKFVTFQWTCLIEQSFFMPSVLSMQALLSNPELDDIFVLNPSAARLLKEAPCTYKQMVLDCVTASLRIDGELMCMCMV